LIRGRSSLALLAATGCALGVLVGGLLAFDWPPARARDAMSLAGFLTLRANPRLDSVATWITNAAATPLPFVLLGALLVMIALARRLSRLAAAVAIAIAGASATSELLKQALARPRHSDLGGLSHQISPASFPSGHATAAMSVALCAVLVAPPLFRPLAAVLGTALALAVGYSVLIVGWHYPSDVLGGFLVAGAWVSLALAVPWSREPTRRSRQPAPAPRSAPRGAPLLAAVLAAAGIAGLIAAGGVAPTRAHIVRSVIEGAVAIALLAVAMNTGLVTALRPRSRSARGPAGGEVTSAVSAGSSQGG
jgi:membrane-associated phospholipid phosphatase